jgi:uracil-DNA glycosylase
VFPVPSTARLFNPWRDEEPAFDVPGGARIRRANLRAYFASFARAPRVLLVGEAPGPNGARFSGVPFTSEHLFPTGALPFRARRSGRRERPYREPSATVVHRTLGPRARDVLLWNAVPLHPRPPGETLGIRPPTRAEVVRFLPPLLGLWDALRPRAVAAVGRKAAEALVLLGVPHVPMRHPSHGGALAFEASLRRLLDGT